MREISSDIRFAIARGETLSVRVTRSTRLAVTSGAVWLTRSDDIADYWLEPGHTVRLRRGERLWIGSEGGSAARIAFERPVGARQRAVDALARLALKLGMHVGDGWRTV